MSDSKDSNVFDEAEIRSEVLRTISMGDERRTGDSDRLTVGRVSAVDLVEGHEDATIHGSLREVVDNHRMSLVDRVDYEIKGKLSSKTHSESFMVGGNVVETFAGATLLLAGMSDDMVVGGGSRITAPLDVTMAGLIGMEEKIGSGFIDGVFSEFSAVGINREFGPGVHNCGSVTYEGHILTTQATGMMPLMQTWTGVRNLTLGSHFNQEGTKKARSGLSFGPPPVPPKPPSGVGALARTAAGGGRVQDIEQLSDAARRMDDVAEMATAAEDSRAASNGAQAEVLAELRHGEHFVDATVTADDGTSTTVRLASDLDPNDLDDDELYNLEMTKRLDEMQSQSDQFMTELRQRVQQNLPVDDDPPPIPGPDASGTQNAGAGSSVKKKVQWVDGSGVESDFFEGGVGPGPGLEDWGEPSAKHNELELWQAIGVDSGKYIFASETDAATDQANAVEEMRRVQGDMLEMEWLKRYVVDADPVADEDMYKIQMDVFEEIKANYRKLYDADPKNQTFAAMYRNASIVNRDLFKVDPGMADDEAKRVTKKRLKVSKALRGFQQDYISSMEEYIQAASRPPLGTAEAAESMDKMIDVGALHPSVADDFPSGTREVTFQELVDTSLNKTIEYLEYVQAYGNDPYIDNLPPEAVGNSDAYDMLRGLLDTRDQDTTYTDGVKRYQDLKGGVASQQRQVDNSQINVNAYQRNVDDLKLRIEDLEDRKFRQKGNRNNLDAEIQRLKERLGTAQSNLERQQGMLENAKNELIRRRRMLDKYGDDPHNRLTKRSWRDRQQRVQFILDTLQQAQDDIDEGIDPGARLRTQAEYYYDLGRLGIADSANSGGDDSRKMKGGSKRRPITFQERGDLSRLVLDNLEKLGLNYGLSDAFSTRVPYDFNDIGKLYNLTGAETRPDTLQDSVREAQRLAEAKALAEAASTLADNPPPVRIDAALDPAAGLSHPPGQGAYDFTTGTADNLVDMTRIEAEAAADAPSPSTLDTVPLNQVEAEDPPRQDNIYDDVRTDNIYDQVAPDPDNVYDPVAPDPDNVYDDVRTDNIYDQVAPDPDNIYDPVAPDPDNIYDEVAKDPDNIYDDTVNPDNIYDDTVNPDNVYDNANDYEPNFGNWTLPMTDDGDDYQAPRDLMRWGTDRGPVVSEDGGSTWKTSASSGGNRLSTTTETQRTTGTGATGATGGSGAPSPRTRNPSPPPMEDVEWRGVQAAVPETPTESKPVPKPRTRGPSPTPVETTPLPDGSNKMFGPTAGGQSATVAMDDAALPTGQIDNNWYVGAEPDDYEEYGDISKYIQASNTSPGSADGSGKGFSFDETSEEDVFESIENASKRAWEEQLQEAAWSANVGPQPVGRPAEDASPNPGRPIINGTVGQDDDPWQNATAQGLTVLEGRTRRKSDGREMGFGYARAVDNVLEYDPGTQKYFPETTTFELSENRIIFRAYDIAADDAMLVGDDVTANTRKVTAAEVAAAEIDAGIGVNYMTLEWVQEQIKLSDAAGGVPEQQLSARNSQIFPSSLDERMQKRLELVESFEDLRNSDKAFLDDLKAGRNSGLGGENLRVKMNLKKYGNSDTEQIMGYRQAYSNLATEWEKKGFVDEAATYRRYVDIIDEYNKSRFTKLLEVTDLKDNAQLPAVFRAPFLMSERGHSMDEPVDLSDTLGAAIRTEISDYLKNQELSTVDLTRGRHTATDGSGGTTLMTRNVGDVSEGDNKFLRRVKAETLWESEWDKMVRQNKVLQDPNSKQAQTVAILDQAVKDTENYINPLARIDLEIAYLEDLKKQNLGVDTAANQTRLEALYDARTAVVKADTAHYDMAKRTIDSRAGGYYEYVNKIDGIWDGEIPKAQDNWRLTPNKQREFLAGNRNWSQAGRGRVPNLVRGRQPVFGGRPPPIPSRPPGGWVLP